MNAWLITLLIAVALWLFVAPYLGIGGSLLTVGAFVFSVLCLMKWFRPTSKFVSALPLTPKFAGILGVVILVGGILMAGWFSSYLGGLNLSLGSLGGTPQAATQTANCYLATAPTVTVTFPDKITGSAITTNYAYRKVGTTAWTTGNGASASITADVGSKWEIKAAPDNATYYGDETVVTVPCESYPKAEVPVGTIATSGVVFAVKSPDDTANAAATGYDLSANDKKTFKVTMSGVYQKYVGSPFCGGGYVACRYNSTEFTGISYQDVNGASLGTFSPPDTIPGLTGFSKSGAIIPALAGNGDYVYKLYVEAGSGYDAAPNVTCFVDDFQLYYDGNDNGYKCGAVDETNAGIGLTATETNFTVYVK